MKACSGLVGFIFVASIATVSPAQTSSSVPPQAAPSAASQKSASEEIVCKKFEVTGSRLGKKKVCRTRAQWLDDDLQTRQDIERVQRPGTTKGG